MYLKISSIFFLLFSLAIGQGIEKIPNQQRSDEEIDIRAVLDEQIKQAELRLSVPKDTTSATDSTLASETQIIPQQPVENKAVTPIPVSNKIIKEKVAKTSSWTILTNYFAEQSIFTLVFIGLEVVFVSVVLVFYLIKRKKAKPENDLKETVRLIRSEQVRRKINKEKSKIRTMLTRTSVRIDDGGKSIIKFARQQEIAKGEIFLAVKLRALLSMYR